MPSPRHLPLYDPAVHPSSWNERMAPGEFAVHYAAVQPGPPGTCDIFPSLPEAEVYANAQILLHPDMRCRIYDHHGFVGAPIREICGPDFKDNSELSSRSRRWVGFGCLLLGIGLITIDWLDSFRLVWAYTIGLPLLLPGAVLIFMEALVVLTRRRRAAHPPQY
jgi:hypothetical protein